MLRFFNAIKKYFISEKIAMIESTSKKEIKGVLKYEAKPNSVLTEQEKEIETVLNFYRPSPEIIKQSIEFWSASPQPLSYIPKIFYNLRQTGLSLTKLLFALLNIKDRAM